MAGLATLYHVPRKRRMVAGLHLSPEVLFEGPSARLLWRGWWCVRQVGIRACGIAAGEGDDAEARARTIKPRETDPPVFVFMNTFCDQESMDAGCGKVVVDNLTGVSEALGN